MKSKNIIFFIGLLLIVAVTGLGGLLFYYPTPTYNPFDDVFNVSRDRLIKEGCKEEIIMCGYVNVIKDFGDGIKMCYQFFADETVVQAKGMVIEIDTLWNDCGFGDGKLIDNRKRRFDSLKIDFDMIKRKLKKFDVELLSIQKSEYDFVLDVNTIYKPQKKEFKLKIRVYQGERFVELFYPKPKSQKTAKEHLEAVQIYFMDLLGVYR